MQDISMQIKRLEEVVDNLHLKSEAKLGVSDTITRNALQAIFYLQGLKYDLNILSELKENINESN
jgi:hypothetical protein